MLWRPVLLLAFIATHAEATAIFFDDFRHAGQRQLLEAGWKLREAPGHPGIPGARWNPGGIALLPLTEGQGNDSVRLTASTDGTAAGTHQTQLCHARKYFEGTTAARMRFRDAPDAGSDGDVVVQTFYLVSPLRFDFDPLYSEMDWEYLANGGWGDPKTRLYAVTWQTVRLDPWQAHNQSDQQFDTLDGWHTLVMQAKDGETHYFVDGKAIGQHGGRNYPVVPMALNFNLWFSPGGAPAEATGTRAYSMDIDWVYHARNEALAPASVDAAVRTLRAAGISHTDNVPEANPALPYDCAM